MKKVIIIGSLWALLIGLAGCKTTSTKESSTEETKKVTAPLRSSSSKPERHSTENTSEQSAETPETSESVETPKTPETPETSQSDGKLSDVGFKELLSGIKYNKEYLTEDQITELKELHKADLTEKQYQEFVKALEE
ncbi:hypothetical protein KQI58_00780 [Enterococcus raffinosus]|uniref:hypothetical protein n=1 Tax=Enterococcus raffinosus TaxID=71452 RepID=UPI001C1042CE|nr:hypothetical protein [Enterococcus raffinosus]MBU5359604.1 hypothetical protein [Enterococcus raffinosus]